MHICPHCGFNLHADEPVERDGWSLTPTETFLDGRDTELPITPAALLYALARANGRWMSLEALGNRISDCEEPEILVRTYVCKLRRRFGDRTPIETKRGLGYRWKAAA